MSTAASWKVSSSAVTLAMSGKAYTPSLTTIRRRTPPVQTLASHSQMTSITSMPDSTGRTPLQSLRNIQTLHSSHLLPLSSVISKCGNCSGSKTAGLDNISSSVIKKSADQLSAVFTDLFNSSLQQCLALRHQLSYLCKKVNSYSSE